MMMMTQNTDIAQSIKKRKGFAL